MTKIHQTGTREAWTFRHDDHSDTIVILPTSEGEKWYVIREHGHHLVNPIAVMTDAEVLEVFGFDVNAWKDADNRPFP